MPPMKMPISMFQPEDGRHPEGQGDQQGDAHGGRQAGQGADQRSAENTNEDGPQAIWPEYRKGIS